MRRTIQITLIVISGCMLLGVIILAVLKVMPSAKISDDTTNFACGGSTGLICSEGYLCVQNNRDSLIDSTGVCVFDD